MYMEMLRASARSRSDKRLHNNGALDRGFYPIFPDFIRQPSQLAFFL